MRLRSFLIVSLALTSAAAFAQNSGQSATYPTAGGDLTVHTGQPARRDFGPPPDFAQLDRRHTGSLTAEDADAYPPLANDFIHADGNRDGRISKAEYERWAKASR